MIKGTDSSSPWQIPDRGLERGQHWQILHQLIIMKVTNSLFYFTLILFLFFKLGLILFLLVVIRIFWGER